MECANLRILYYIAVAWGAGIFWLAPHPPMIDLPQHAGQIALLRDYVLNTSVWSSFFQINIFTPYLVGYGLALPLSLFMPIAAAMKLLLSLAYLAYIFMCVRIRQHLDADPRLDWLFLPSYFGFSYSWGLFTFLVAAPVCLFFILLADRYSQDRTPSRALSILIAGLALLVSHGLTFAFGWCVGMGFLVSRALKWKTFIVSAIPYGILAIASMGYLVIGRQVDADIIDSPSIMVFGRNPIFRLGEAVILPFVSSGLELASRLNFAPVAIAMFGAPILLRLRVDWRNRSCWVPFLVVCLVFFLVPHVANNTSFLYQRFSLFILPAFAWMFHRSLSFKESIPLPNMAISKVMQFLLVSSCLFALGLTTVKAWRFGQETAGIDALIGTLEPEKRALGLVLNRASTAADNVNVYLHYASWYQAERQGLTDFNFAWFTPQIVRYRPASRPPVKSDFENLPEGFDWKQYRGADYKYIFVRSDEEVSKRLFRGAECMPKPLGTRGLWTVYESCAAIKLVLSTKQ